MRDTTPICLTILAVFLLGLLAQGCNHHDIERAHVPSGGLGNGTVEVWLPATWSDARRQNQLASLGTSWVEFLNTQGAWFWSLNGRLYSWGTGVYAPGQSPRGWQLWVAKEDWLTSKHAPRPGFGFVDRKDQQIWVASRDCVAPWTLRMLVEAWVDPDPYWTDPVVWDPILGRGPWAGFGIEEALIRQLTRWWTPCPP